MLLRSDAPLRKGARPADLELKAPPVGADVWAVGFPPPPSWPPR